MFRRKRKLAVFYDSLPGALTPEKKALNRKYEEKFWEKHKK